MKTSVPSVKMKFAVHCAPSVTVCTPGWIAAVAAGAHVGAAPPPAGESPNVPSATTAPTPTNRNHLRTASPRGRNPTDRREVPGPRRPQTGGSRVELPLISHIESDPTLRDGQVGSS